MYPRSRRAQARRTVRQGAPRLQCGRAAFAVLPRLALVLARRARGRLERRRGRHRHPMSILFVPDGTARRMVSMETAPALASLAREGVTFRNSHSVYPTLTMPNAAALATGHYPGDTGVFGNSLLMPFSCEAPPGRALPQIEKDAVLGELEERMGGSFVPQSTCSRWRAAPATARPPSASTGPALLQDHGAPRRPQHHRRSTTSTGTPRRRAARSGGGGGHDGGGPRHRGAAARRQRARRQFRDTRHDDAQRRAAELDSPTSPRAWCCRCSRRGAGPSCSSYWSRDPDGSQHNQGDSFGRCSRGSTVPRRWRASATPTTTCAACARRWSRSTAADDQHHRGRRSRFLDGVARERTSPAAKRQLRRRGARPSAAGFPRAGSGRGARPAAVGSRPEEPPRGRRASTRTGTASSAATRPTPEAIVAADGGVALIYLLGAAAARAGARASSPR